MGAAPPSELGSTSRMAAMLAAAKSALPHRATSRANDASFVKNLHSALVGDNLGCRPSSGRVREWLQGMQRESGHLLEVQLQRD